MGLPASGCTDRPTDRAVGDQIGVVVGSSGDLVAEERVVVPASRTSYGDSSAMATALFGTILVPQEDPPSGTASGGRRLPQRIYPTLLSGATWVA